MVAELFMGVVAYRNNQISWRQDMFDPGRSPRIHLQIVATCGGHRTGMDFGNGVCTR